MVLAPLGAPLAPNHIGHAEKGGARNTGRGTRLGNGKRLEILDLGAALLGQSMRQRVRRGDAQGAGCPNLHAAPFGKRLDQGAMHLSPRDHRLGERGLAADGSGIDEDGTLDHDDRTDRRLRPRIDATAANQENGIRAMCGKKGGGGVRGRDEADANRACFLTITLGKRGQLGCKSREDEHRILGCLTTHSRLPLIVVSARARILCLTGPAFGVLTVGCSTNIAASSEAADAEASAVTAIVTVDRTAGAAGTEGSKSDMIARFVRSRAGAVDDDALRIVGAAIDLPAAGSCARLPTANSAVKMARSLELVNVGALSFEMAAPPSSDAKPDYQGKLVARHLPDVVDLVSGVVYTGRGEGDAFPARGRYVFHAAGAPEQEIAPFTVEATAKGEPGELRIADQAVVHRTDAGPFSVSATEPTEVTWTPPADATADDDVIYIDVSARPPGAATVRCSFGDTGHATLAPTSFTSDEGTITVHRVHRVPFRAKGIDSGVLRFDFARVSSFRRQSSQDAAAFQHR